jgi:hypothetical protein
MGQIFVDFLQLEKNKKGSEALKNKGFSISCNLRTNQKSAGGGH